MKRLLKVLEQVAQVANNMPCPFEGKYRKFESGYLDNYKIHTFT